MQATQTRRNRKPRVKPVRRVCLSLAPSHGGPGVIDITEGEGDKAKMTSFYLTPIQADFGRGFHLEKFSIDVRGDDDAEYDVNLDGENSLCHCKGFDRWGHCRHVEALQALENAGKL